MVCLLLLSAIEPLALEGSSKLAASIIFGLVLGVFLVKSNLSDRKQVLENLTFARTELTRMLLLALALGMIVFVLLRDIHCVQAHLPESTIWGVMLGGIISGIGLGIGGLVPVTALASLASGRIYALWVLLGMVLAIPAAKLLQKYIPEVIGNFSDPVNISLEPADSLFALNSPVLILSIVSLILCFVLQMFGPKSSDK